MFGKMIWDKLPECIFETSKISKFSNITKVIDPKNCPNQTCGCWLITRNQQTLSIETHMFYPFPPKFSFVFMQSGSRFFLNES